MGTTKCGMVRVEGRDQGFGFRHGQFERLIRKPSGEVSISSMYMRLEFGVKV